MIFFHSLSLPHSLRHCMHLFALFSGELNSFWFALIINFLLAAMFVLLENREMNQSTCMSWWILMIDRCILLSLIWYAIRLSKKREIARWPKTLEMKKKIRVDEKYEKKTRQREPDWTCMYDFIRPKMETYFPPLPVTRNSSFFSFSHSPLSSLFTPSPSRRRRRSFRSNSLQFRARDCWLYFSSHSLHVCCCCLPSSLSYRHNTELEKDRWACGEAEKEEKREKTQKNTKNVQGIQMI